jgi:hypothetical protein
MPDSKIRPNDHKPSLSHILKIHFAFKYSEVYVLKKQFLRQKPGKWAKIRGITGNFADSPQTGTNLFRFAPKCGKIRGKTALFWGIPGVFRGF